MKISKTNPQIAALLRILDQAFDQRAWHGTNLRGSLRGLSARDVAWRPRTGRHNIWELALHCAYWKYCVRRLLLGEKRGGFPTPGSNFWVRPQQGRAATDKDWNETVALLEEQHRRLRAAVAGFPAARLQRRASPRGWTYFQTIIGIASHDLYHAGQIQLLKRLLRSKRRSRTRG
jgi:hypothetical protein